MPSTYSTLVSVVLPSSTVITPSLPTRCSASAKSSPIALSLLALIAPTAETSSLLVTFFAISMSLPVAASTALSMPRRMAVGLLPATTFRRPSRKMARASTVAVVVPSPARSEVFWATSTTSFAPMFSKRSSRSTSLATVTPSFVTVGPPKDLSIITFLPVGPIVTATALASLSTPASMRARARSSNRSCLGTCKFLRKCFAWFTPSPFGRGPGKGLGFARLNCSRENPHPTERGQEISDHLRQNIALAEDFDIFAADFDVGSPVLAVDHFVADLYREFPAFAAVQELAGTDGDDRPALRLLFGAIGED